jgi:uncharacterized protein (DUF1330 family)
MPAYVTVNFTPTDKEKLQQYVAAVPATLAKYSGEFLVKGVFEKLSGNTDYEMQVILVFPTKEQAAGWYHSTDYQALIPLRDVGMRSQFQLIST